jgi:hypothetical protein
MEQDGERRTGVGGETVGDEVVVVGQIGTVVDHVTRWITKNVSLLDHLRDKAISYETAEKMKKFASDGRVRRGRVPLDQPNERRLDTM